MKEITGEDWERYWRKIGGNRIGTRARVIKSETMDKDNDKDNEKDIDMYLDKNKDVEMWSYIKQGSRFTLFCNIISALNFSSATYYVASVISEE